MRILEEIVWWFINWHYSRRWGQYDRKVKDVERSLYEEGVFLQKGEEKLREKAEKSLEDLRAWRKYYAKKLGLIRD